MSLIKCPKCGGYEVSFWKDYITSQIWFQLDENHPADIWDSDDGDSHPIDNKLYFICHNSDCRHQWEEEGEPEDYTT